MAGINRPMSQMRKLEAKESLFHARKRILQQLVLGWLRQEGLLQTADMLATEAGLGEYELCDNIDLDIVLQDYCSYYLMRFNKAPQFCRKVEERPNSRPPSRRPQTRKARVVETEVKEVQVPVVTVTRLLQENTIAATETIPTIERKPIAGFLANASPEKKAIAEMLYQCIIRNSGVEWDDVKGLDDAKSILMESVVYPVKYPDLFTGLLEPWRGVLLHGPPGSGKTLLARAVAGESGCVFFNITCSTLVNKWRGESEKIVKVLFEMASYFSPSVIFMDEAEALTCSRQHEHEASRRLTSQLLAELDGVKTREGSVLLMMTTNMPWEIDPAILRRLEKRIFIPLPDFSARVELFKKYLGGVDIQITPAVDYEELARKTEGYSGSDVKLACKEALMTGVRKVLKGGNNQNKIEKISLSDVLEAIEKTKPVSRNLSKRHQDWQREMGST
ncbi:katanin p60 ATPase-containing subunit A-like 2 [Aricia agestis]|uniref:katanin p60 ATPase-containing subunit A-like 2 n=1 Tax=Aricia agestis TaxID=91739 RepID=UPI001C20B52B|nr:katanin p60 ATPase-containing subunit A-like 2 [Aricia agestis]